jgi:hypothetical protein
VKIQTELAYLPPPDHCAEWTQFRLDPIYNVNSLSLIDVCDDIGRRRRGEVKVVQGVDLPTTLSAGGRVFEAWSAGLSVQNNQNTFLVPVIDDQGKNGCVEVMAVNESPSFETDERCITRLATPDLTWVIF